MKKFALILVMVASVAIAFGQKNVRQSASNFLKNGQLDKALEAINACILDPSTANDAKAWKIRGDIYLQIANSQPSFKVGMSKEQVKSLAGKPKKTNETVYENLKSEQWIYDDTYLYFDETGKLKAWQQTKSYNLGDIDPVVVALESYKKAIEFDPKKEYKEEIDIKLDWQRNNYYNIAVENYNDKLYKEAMQNFARSAEVKEISGTPDTTAILNAAACATLANEKEASKGYYIKLLKANYKSPTVFITLSDLYRQDKDSVNALKYVQMGQQVYPSDMRIFLAETNIYLTFNNTNKALKNLKLALAQDSTNYSVAFALGTIYDNLSNDTLKSAEFKQEAFSNAIAAYKNSIRLNPNYFEGNYNLGALYVNKAASINDEANKLPLDASAKFEKLSKEANEYLGFALPYLEKAIEMQPNDANTLYTLKQIYTRTNQPAKVKAIQEKLNSLPK